MELTKAEQWEDFVVKTAESLELKAKEYEEAGHAEPAASYRYLKGILYGYCGLSSYDKAALLVQGAMFYEGTEATFLAKHYMVGVVLKTMRDTGLVE